MKGVLAFRRALRFILKMFSWNGTQPAGPMFILWISIYILGFIVCTTMFCRLYNQSRLWPVGLFTRSHRISPATASVQCLETHDHSQDQFHRVVFAWMCVCVCVAVAESVRRRNIVMKWAHRSVGSIFSSFESRVAEKTLWFYTWNRVRYLWEAKPTDYNETNGLSIFRPLSEIVWLSLLTSRMWNLCCVVCVHATL